MKTIIKSTLILVAITLVAGLALASVYEITKVPIADAERKAKENAYRAVMPDAASFIALGVLESEQYPVDIAGILVNECRTAMDASGNFIGYVVNVTSPNGYGGNITIAVGVRKDLTIEGVSVISQGETAGLGAKCADAAFTDQFKGIAGFVGFGNTDLPESNRIDAISGATITTSAVTESVNIAVHYAEIQMLATQGGND